MIRTGNLENRTIISKGQKIIAALFLVTAHLGESDPLRIRVRSLAVSLAESAPQERQTIAGAITTLLEAAVIARLVSEQNARIIETELRYLVDPLYQFDGSISALFPSSPTDKGHVLNKTTSYSDMSFIKKTSLTNVSEKKVLNKENRNKRQDLILSYINDRKSANIKDISALFPGTSEKTIQRELGALVLDGKIRKHGNKRWSLYLSLEK